MPTVTPAPEPGRPLETASLFAPTFPSVTVLAAIAVLGITPALASAQGTQLPDRRTMTAERMAENEEIELDGILDEAVWGRAAPATDFIQTDPVFEGTPTERTEVRIVFSAESLYMGVSAFDSEPDQLLGNTMKRDEFLSADDRFMWTIDTFFDQQTGYFFEMNPSGLMADALLVAGGGNERAWDGIWDAYVRRHDEGYTIEIEIPFRTLNFDPEAPAWGINFQRTIRRKNEENLWTGYQRNQGLRSMANAGLLLGISDVDQGYGLDVKPYVTASTFDGPGLDPVVDRENDANYGVDLFYNVTPSLRANLTVNTDFAQTEVDQRLVNLTRFPLRFPERRDFFLDGSPFFDFAADAVEPFFSRRIGLTGGAPQKIDVGAKLTGQAGAQDIGFLHIRTGDERDDGGPVGEDFTVLRLKRRILTQSYVGSFLSRRSARVSDSDDLYTAGADVRLATNTFRGSDNLEMTGYVLWNTDTATIPEEEGENLSYGVGLSYPNDLWSGSVGYAEVQQNHNPSIGFTPRRGFRQYEASVGYGPRPERYPWIRQLNMQASLDLRTNMQNDMVTRSLQLQLLRVQLQSGDNVSFQVTPTYELLERDFEISDGVVLPAGSDYDFTRYRISAGTANRRIIAMNTAFGWGDFFSGQREEFTVSMGIRPMVGVVANIQSEWNQIDLPEGEFDTQVYRFTLDTQFNPWIFVVNNVQYDSVSEELGWQARLRWTVSPGNDLYIIYQQNWIEDPLDEQLFTQDRRAAAKFVYTYRP